MSEYRKPREWKIEYVKGDHGGFARCVLGAWHTEKSEVIHVIEKYAFDLLERKLEIAVEALKFISSYGEIMATKDDANNALEKIKELDK